MSTKELRDCEVDTVVHIVGRGKALVYEQQDDKTIVKINGSRISYYNTKKVEVIEK